MFLPSTPDLDSEDPDPALLAFVKCHITSPARWEVLRILASNNGAWLNGEELARATHRQLRDLTRELDQLVADDVVLAEQRAGVERVQVADRIGVRRRRRRLQLHAPDG